MRDVLTLWSSSSCCRVRQWVRLESGCSLLGRLLFLSLWQSVRWEIAYYTTTALPEYDTCLQEVVSREHIPELCSELPHEEGKLTFTEYSLSCKKITFPNDLHSNSNSITPDPPTHLQVLEWRSTLERLERLTRLVNGLIAQLLQRLVLKALSSLRFMTGRLIRQSLERLADQDKSFVKMGERVASNPFSQSILDKHDIGLDEEDHLGLVSMQALSFSKLLPSVESDESLLQS